MRKKSLIRSRILILTISGFLLIFLSGNSFPYNTISLSPAEPSSAAADETASEVFFLTEPGSFSTGADDAWDSPSSLNSILRLDEAENGGDGCESEPDEAAAARIMERFRLAFSGISRALSGLAPDQTESDKPSVIKYNLMALYPEKTDSLNPENAEYTQKEQLMRLLKQNLNPFYELFSLSFRTGASSSYGGQMYEYLSRKDAGWASGIYKWLQASPEQAARMMGRPAASVRGRYDPTDEKHDPADPGTWLVPSWKNVTFRFYDGDGKPIPLRSNTQEIASMASVYTYYTGWDDVDQFRAYADQLWEASHSYQVGMGEVYYCDGCVDPSTAQETALNQTEDGQAENPQGDAPDGGTEASEAPALAPAQVENSESPQEENGGGEAQAQAAKSSPDGTRTDLSLPQAEAQPVNQNSDAALREPAHGAPETPAAASSSELSGQSDPALAAASGQAEAESSQPGLSDPAAAGQSAEIHLNAEGKFCPGHVDLTITGRITGLSERKNLFTLDRIGKNAAENWNGWSPYSMAYVRQLNAQDWAVRYGLTPLELALGTPLSLAEINQYLSLLPADVSAERRAVISYALHTVGKVPYYYGGKAKAPGFEDNHFASLTLPDKKGRVLSGLDCSGWVNWVYWSALGQQPTHLGTSGLIHAGTAVSRSDLKPGDIIVRLGTNSHVMMFLAWAPNGSMICVHETGGSVSNVTVSTVAANWPYYRSLLD